MSTFVLKSAEEITAMNDTQKAEYFAAKFGHDNQQLQEAIKGKASQDQLKELRDEIVSSHNSQLQEVQKLTEAVKQQGLAIRRGMVSGGDEKPVSIKQLLSSNIDGLKAIKAGEKSGFSTLSVKAPGDMTFTNVVSGEIPQAQRLPGLDVLPLRPRSLINFVNRSGIGRPVVSWEYMVDREGEPAPTAEAATKPINDFSLNVASETAGKYAARMRVSMEMLDDIDYLENEIRTDLLDRLLLDIEDDMYDGSGAATPQNLRGLRTVASAFAAPTGMAAAIDNADTLDVLNAAMTQILLADQPDATHILMNPVDVALMRSTKVSTTDRRRVMSLYNTAEGMEFLDALFIPSRMVDQDDFLVGYLPYATLYDYMGVTIKVGLDGNDFSQNMVTFIAEWRGMQVVKNNRRPAFVAGDFTSAKTALETP